jgi:hypothetical protein
VQRATAVGNRTRSSWARTGNRVPGAVGTLRPSVAIVAGATIPAAGPPLSLRPTTGQPGRRSRSRLAAACRER